MKTLSQNDLSLFGLSVNSDDRELLSLLPMTLEEAQKSYKVCRNNRQVAFVCVRRK